MPCEVLLRSCLMRSADVSKMQCSWTTRMGPFVSNPLCGSDKQKGLCSSAGELLADTDVFGQLVPHFRDKVLTGGTWVIGR